MNFSSSLIFKKQGINTPNSQTLFDLVNFYNNNDKKIFQTYKVWQVYFNDTRLTQSSKSLLKNDLKEIISKDNLKIIIHLSYSFNLSNSKWIPQLQDLLDFFVETNIKYCVLHVGKGNSPNQFLNNLSQINKTSHKKILLIENPAGQGTELLSDSFKNFYNQIYKKLSFGICFDTCHAFSSGQDIIKILSNKEFYKSIKLIHLNDSSTPFSSHKDRHSPLFTGTIPSDILNLVIEKYSSKKLTILETDSLSSLEKYFKPFNKKLTLRLDSSNVNRKSPNKKIAKIIFDLSFEEKNPYAKRALQNASTIIENEVDFKITLSNYKDLLSFKGIGEGVIERVYKILTDNIIYSPSQPKSNKNRIKRSALKKLSRKYEVVGSYRRGREILGDIDIIIRSPFQLEKLLNETTFFKSIDILSEGDYKLRLKVIFLPHSKTQKINIDILKVFNKEEYPTSLLYFTGPKSFNIYLRRKAKDLLYKLNEHGLYDLTDNSKRVHIKDEKHIFKILKEKYIEPSKRDFI